jgi:transposase
VVASGGHDQGAAVLALGTVGTRPWDLDTRLRPLQAKRQPRVCVDEAGPGGSWLSHSLTHQGDGCWVVAPSWRPPKAGARGKPDRRDARPLARLRRSGALTPVEVPAVDAAAIRALSRAREAPRRELQTATWRLHAFVRRHARRSPGRAPWRPAPRRWLSAGGGPTPGPPRVWPEDVETGPAPPEHVPRLDHALHAPGHPGRCAPGVAACQACRGVPVMGAVPTVAALGALTRCDTRRQRRPSRGLTPSASARGARRQPGRLTKTGPPPARRALVEGAGASREPAHVSRPRPRRRAPRPTALQARRWQAPVRFCPRERPRMAQGPKAPPVGGALARALRACLGAMAQQGPVPPPA